MQAATRLLRALADPTRLRILALLSAGDVCVCDIHRSLRISQPKASRHLAQLRQAGLVATRRDGLWIHYRRATPADAVITRMLDAVLGALPHTDTVRRDAGALARANGCAVVPLRNVRAGLRPRRAPTSRSPRSHA
jgi:ArsR family transcriptional regulator, arsenate/arsenite/antimonite-responsive transcriptional repressor